MTYVDFEEAVQDAINRDQDTQSHQVNEAHVYHPSELVYCKRRTFCKQLGVEHVDDDLRGIFHTGNLIHEWLEQNLALPATAQREKSLRYSIGSHEHAPVITGTADVIDYEERVVVDYKTRASFYNHNPPVDRHVDQVQLYMHSIIDQEAEDKTFVPPKAKIVYISKKDFGVKPYPRGDDEWIRYDPKRVSDLVADKAQDVTHEILRLMDEYGCSYDELTDHINEEDIPYDECGCYFCQQEELIL